MHMRGRRPDEVAIRGPDKSKLERIAHSDTLPWFRVRRARIVLGMAAGRRREVLASELDCDESTIWRTCQRYQRLGLMGLLTDQRQGHSGRDLQITPVQRAQIVELACLEPVAKGLHITHWSSDDLARQAVADGIVAGVSARTVRYILNDVDLQPHRTRYWKTARLDARFKDRAEQVLWCYGNAARLAEQGTWVVCVDEIPTFQVLEREPIRRAIPGSIEQQEFDYTRHGTVNMLLFLVVHTGLMELVFLRANDHEHYVPELELFRKQHQELREVFLIQDGGSSHIAGATQNYFAKNKDWWKPRYTPANASWLNQAEILIHAFKHYYLKRASWKSQEEFKTHVLASWPEYNHRYAHPFEWTWTNQRMRQWFAKHAAGI
jgi:DDE superfamily endonuclease/Homeodomain-like domain